MMGEWEEVGQFFFFAAVPTPSSVQSFCMLTTWSPPIGPYDMYSGYDVRYFNISGNEVIFEVANNKFYLVFADYKEVLGLGAPRDVLVQVGDERG